MSVSIYVPAHGCVPVFSFQNICDAERLVGVCEHQFCGHPSLYDLIKGQSTALALWAVAFSTVGRVLKQRFHILESQSAVL